MSGLKPSVWIQRAGFGNLRLKDSRFTAANCFNTATYIGALIFVLALPFGYSTAFLNLGLSFVFLGWVGRIISDPAHTWQRTPLDIPILLFLGLGLIASLLAPNPATSSLGYFWKQLRAVLLFYAVIHSQLGDRWRQVVIAFIFAAGLSSALGLWYYANDTRLAIDFMGRIGLQFQRELAAGEGFSTALRAELRDCNVPLSETASLLPANQPDAWRIDDLARDRRYVVRKGEKHLRVYMIEQRLTGTFKMPNDLGAYLALTLPFIMGYFIGGWHGIAAGSKRTEALRRSHSVWIGGTLLLAGVLILMGINLVLTLTRAAWVSVTVAGSSVGGYLLISALRTRISWKQSLLGLGLGAALFCVLMVNPGARQAIVDVVPRHITERLQTLTTHPAGFMSERPQWWRTSLQLIQENPITGIGLGRFRYEYQHKGPDVQYYTPYHAHNIYLHIAAEQGVPSLFVFLWLLASICRQVFAMRRADAFWGMGTFVGASGFLISALVYGLADNILHQRTVLLFWFIIGIVFYSQRSEEKSYEKTPQPD